jgi:DNA-binding NarL/FixJ family response regulator
LIAQKSSSSAPIVLIGQRALFREALGHYISAEFGCPVASYPDVESWQKASSDLCTALIVLDIFDKTENQRCLENICQLKESGNTAPIIVFSDAEGVDQIAETLKCGARGHVPTSTPLNIAMKAIRIVLVGGVFVPADALLSERGLREDHSHSDQDRLFTAREKAVVDALRKGKPNKLIAHELNMSESTVKVHIHKIMKKLQARNRTEAVISLLGRGAAERD